MAKKTGAGKCVCPKDGSKCSTCGKTCKTCGGSSK